jgi:hypothetical protein
MKLSGEPKREKRTEKVKAYLAQQAVGRRKQLQSHSYPEDYRGTKNVDSWAARARGYEGSKVK